MLCLALWVCLVAGQALAQEDGQEMAQKEAPHESEGPSQIHDLLMSMQSQLTAYQTTQGRARSVLNVLREVQSSQARDHHVLKQRVFEMEQREARDRQLINALTGRVSNNDWGIVNLKGEHEQVRKDLGTIKTLRRRRHHNSTAVDEIITQSIQLQWQQRDAIQQLQQELISLKASIESSATTQSSNPKYHQAVLAVDMDQRQALERGVFDDKMDATTAPSTDRPDITASHSQSTDEDRRKEDGLTEAEEGERSHWVELARLSLQQEEQAASLTRLQLQLLNTTLQLTRLESQQLRREATHEHTELSDMRHTLVNFTERLLGMQQRPLSSDSAFPAAQRVSETLLNHNERIVAAEEIIYAMRSTSRDQGVTVDRLNTSVVTLADRLGQHHVKADNVFKNADEQLAELRLRTKHQEERLASLERDVLNASLRACRKSNMDLVQDTKLSDFGRSVRKVDNKLLTQTGRITKTSQGVNRLFEITKTQGKAVNNALNQMGNLLAVLPDVATLKADVSNVLLQLPIDCAGVISMKPAGVPVNGIYVIRPGGATYSQRVVCEFKPSREASENGVAAWTLIQHRGDASITFDRTWAEYKHGFGDPGSDFWIGNRALYRLTQHAAYRLRIEMQSTSGDAWWAEYDQFSVASEEDDFRLSVAGYRGNATDALRYSDGAGFSTGDADHDSSSTHCARLYAAGWWYRHCHYGNLNGRYAVGVVWFNQDVDEWMQMSGTVMKIQLAPPGGANVTNTTGGKHLEVVGGIEVGSV